VDQTNPSKSSSHDRRQSVFPSASSSPGSSPSSRPPTAPCHHRHAQQEILEPNVASYTTTIGTCAKQGAQTAAAAYTTTIGTCAKQGAQNAAAASMWLERMRMPPPPTPPPSTRAPSRAPRTLPPPPRGSSGCGCAASGPTTTPTTRRWRRASTARRAHLRRRQDLDGHAGGRRDGDPLRPQGLVRLLLHAPGLVHQGAGAAVDEAAAGELAEYPRHQQRVSRHQSRGQEGGDECEGLGGSRRRNRGPLKT
jgi:hypothetical protein